MVIVKVSVFDSKYKAFFLLPGLSRHMTVSDLKYAVSGRLRLSGLYKGYGKMEIYDHYNNHISDNDTINKFVRNSMDGPECNFVIL